MPTPLPAHLGLERCCGPWPAPLPQGAPKALLPPAHLILRNTGVTHTLACDTSSQQRGCPMPRQRVGGGACWVPLLSHSPPLITSHTPPVLPVSRSHRTSTSLFRKHRHPSWTILGLCPAQGVGGGVVYHNPPRRPSLGARWCYRPLSGGYRAPAVPWRRPWPRVPLLSYHPHA